MGNLEMELLLKYGIPLAAKLLKSGESEEKVIEAVITTVSGLKDAPDIGEALAKADKEQAKGIIEGLFGVLTGVVGAFGGLLKAFYGLFGGK